MIFAGQPVVGRFPPGVLSMWKMRVEKRRAGFNLVTVNNETKI